MFCGQGSYTDTVSAPCFNFIRATACGLKMGWLICLLSLNTRNGDRWAAV